MTWTKLRRLQSHEHPALDPAYAHGDGNNRGPDEVWLSDLYEVWVWRGWESPAAYQVPGLPDVDYLSVKQRSKDVIRDWRHLQTIKNELCGYEQEGIEIYPAESRLVDESNQYHLFVFPAGFSVPYGDFSGRHVSDDAPDRYEHGKARQRPFEPGTRVPSSARKRDRRKK